MVAGLIAVAGLVPEAKAIELTGSLGVEARAFVDDAQFSEQHAENGSVVVQPELYHDWSDGDQSILFSPFFRWDQGDDERTHFDIRELRWLMVSGSVELRIGLQRVFWGVTETQHLVDILNQTDLVENVDGEDKLGQPMVRVDWVQDWGTVALFALPGFRERTFPGAEGRLRFPVVIDTDNARFESDAAEKHVDFAARWSRFIGAFDVGLSHFHGTSRDPRFLLGEPVAGQPRLVPYYDQIDQTSADIQMTAGGWLWKLEALHRSGQGRTFNAISGGFEYTLVGIFERAWDVGLLSEYHYDDRLEDAPTPLEDDIFVGARLALNDVQSTTLLVGAILDVQSDGTAFFAEASRRVGDRWTVSVEARAIAGTESNDPLHALRTDDFFQLELLRYF